MESKHEAPSIILRLMGVDEVPPQHPVGNTQKVLSEKYMQKVASIGIRKKRSSCEHDSFRMSSDKKGEPVYTSKVVKTIRRDEYHNPSTGNWKAKGVQQMLSDDASYTWDNGKPETLVDGISSSSFGTSVSSRRMVEQGNLQRQQRLDNGLLEDVYRDAGLCETLRFSRSQLDQKDETLNSRSSVLKENPGNGLKYFSFPRSCENSHFSNGLLKEIFCPKIKRAYPEMKGRKRMSFHKDSFQFVSNVSEEVPTRTRNVANKVLYTVPSSFSRRNEASVNSSDMFKPSSNVSVNATQCNSPSFCSYDSYVGSDAKNKTMKRSDMTEKRQEVGRRRHVSTHYKLPMIFERGNGARNFSYLSGFSNDKIKRNIRYKVGVNYSIARKVPTARSLCSASVIADNHRTMSNDNLFQKYWGLRKNASANWPTLKLKYRNIIKNDCLQDMNPKSSSNKSPSVSSYFNIEENCTGLQKLKKICYRNDLSDNKPTVPQFSRSGPSPTFIDSQILHETSFNVDGKNYMHEDSNMSKQNSLSPNWSVDCSVSDAKVEVVGMSYINPTKKQSESTEHRDHESLSHGSYASMQQDTLESKDSSVYSIYSGTEPDSLGNFDGVYEPSPVSVLDLVFREDISSSSECLKDVGDGGYDSSEVDYGGFGLNVSSDDDDCGDEYVGDFKEKQDLVGMFRAEESRDFSYVVEVLTEAGNCNRSLFTDVSTWHTAECPISPSVFENLEKKFGGQQLWKRSERRLVFDRINLGLFEILQPCAYIPKWEKPVSRRLNPELRQGMIEEELWGLLVSQEKEASKESADKMLDGKIRWTELRDDIEVIVKVIVTLLIEELANELVS